MRESRGSEKSLKEMIIVRDVLLNGTTAKQEFKSCQLTFAKNMLPSKGFSPQMQANITLSWMVMLNCAYAGSYIVAGTVV